MLIKLTDTSSRDIINAVLKARSNIGSTTGMVMTLMVEAEQRTFERTYQAALVAAREHPCRLILVVRTMGKTDKLDAEIHLADVPGEVILLRLSGELRSHADSIVLPLLLPDSPVVMWWPARSPERPGDDLLGSLADRRITDAEGDPKPIEAIRTRARYHSAGDTDLAWTRLTKWRALLAAALDQYPTIVQSASVSAARTNAPADLMAAWLETRLHVPVTRGYSNGPGITQIKMETPGGSIVISREDAKTATYSIPGQPRRTVALKRRDINELLTEELRRMDADDIYEGTLHQLLIRCGQTPPPPADKGIAAPGESPLAGTARTAQEVREDSGEAVTVARTGARSDSRKAARVRRRFAASTTAPAATPSTSAEAVAEEVDSAGQPQPAGQPAPGDDSQPGPSDAPSTSAPEEPKPES